MLPAQALSYFEHLDESFFIKSLANHDYSGQDKEIRILNQAILNQVVLRVVYRSASKGREVVSEFQPYGMVLLHAALYCIGHLASYAEIRTLTVSLVQGLSRMDKTFQKPNDFSLAAHLKGAVGVFQADNLQTIQAEFRGWAATSVRDAMAPQSADHRGERRGGQRYLRAR